MQGHRLNPCSARSHTPTCHGTTKPGHHNYLVPRTCVPWQITAVRILCTPREQPCSPQLEKACSQQQTPRATKNKWAKIKTCLHVLLSHSQLSGKKMGPLWPDLPNFPWEATVASFLTSRFSPQSLCTGLFYPTDKPLTPWSCSALYSDVQLYISIPFPHFSFLHCTY